MYHFEWQVHEMGYQWNEGERPETYLCPCSVAARKKDVQERPTLPRKSYRPLIEFSGLFRIFAELPPSQDCILEFANTYGALTKDVARVEVGVRSQSDENVVESLSTGERYLWWRKEVVTMHRAVTIWDAIQAKDDAILSRFFEFGQTSDNKPCIKFISHPEESPKQRSALAAESEEIWESDILVELPPNQKKTTPPSRTITIAALQLIKGWIEAHLEDKASAKAGVDPEQLKIGFGFVPSDLLSAMWFQFAEAVSEGFKYRSCKVCSFWFRLSPEIARTTRLFCSNACKTKDHRAKQERARQLHTDGMSFREIAKEVGSRVPVVKKWITGKKP